MIIKAEEILQLAAETIKTRGSQNGYDGKEERTAVKIAAIYNAKKGADLTPLDVWDLMICLKEARLQAILANGCDPTDTLVDLISYNALKAEQISMDREQDKAPRPPFGWRGPAFVGTVTNVPNNDITNGACKYRNNNILRGGADLHGVIDVNANGVKHDEKHD